MKNKTPKRIQSTNIDTYSDEVMRCFSDRIVGGHAMIYPSIKSLLQSCRRAASKLGRQYVPFPYETEGGEDKDYFGRTDIRSWDEFEEAIKKPWKEGVDKVEAFIKKLRDKYIQPPRDRKRRLRHSDADGEVNAQRAIKGEGEIYDLPHRTMVYSPQHVVLLSCVTGSCVTTADNLFWRSAATIAIIDLLEDAGYTCECWAWDDGKNCYEDPFPYQFTAIRLKEAGQELDKNTLIAGLSPWLFRLGILNSYADLPLKDAFQWHCAVCYEFHKWQKYLDIRDDVHIVRVPESLNEEAALNDAITVLKRISEEERVDDMRNFKGEGSIVC